MRLAPKDINWGAVSALVVLAGIAVYDNVVPMPGAVRQAPAKTQQELRQDKTKLQVDLQVTQETVDGRTWQVTLDEIGPTAMAWVSDRARSTGIGVSAFRPQRTIDTDGLSQLNYLLTAEGPYLSMLRFVESFEQADSLLAVKGIQMSSVDGASDTVRANISLVAYREGGVGG